MKRFLFLLFVVIISTSCDKHLGDLRTRKLIVGKVYVQSFKSKTAVYTVISTHGAEGCFGSFEFKDDIGKYVVGDTIKLTTY